MASDRGDTEGKISPVYLVMSGERIIEATPEQTWPFLLDYASWQGFSRVETVSGDRGQEGEVVALIKEEQGFVFPPYYARTILIEPGHRIIWKTFLKERTDPIDLSGIVEFRLYRRGDQTAFWYNLIYEFLVPYDHESELTAFQAAQRDNFTNLIESTHPKLKRLVESTYPRNGVAS